jgi:hypothetical protein
MNQGVLKVFVRPGFVIVYRWNGGGRGFPDDSPHSDPFES